MRILNLTQHQATAEQIAAGVEDMHEKESEKLKKLLTFDEIPSEDGILNRARAIAFLAASQNFAVCDDDEAVKPYTHAMIGGAPFLMSALESCLLDDFLTPVYAFSQRQSVEELQEDGSVKKVNVFKHAGFVPAVF